MTYHSNADLGGTEQPGAIIPEAEGDLFHAPWEPRVMALVVALGPTGLSNIDMNRSARETLPNYRRLSYYEIWLAALEKLLLRKGVLGDASPPARGVLKAEMVAAAIRAGTSYSRSPTQAARFAVGDRVRTRPGETAHHTRLPGYARGKIGTVQRVHGVHVFPDTNAHDQGESPQWLYNVAFDAAELWGPQPAQRSIISVDAWEPYLEAA
ncbi:MAG TPA: nitrile hydratase subunit beta [Steroidobacteraceae bacterium]